MTSASSATFNYGESVVPCNLILHPTVVHSVLPPAVAIETDAEGNPCVSADGVVYGGVVKWVVAMCLPANGRIPKRPPVGAIEAKVVQQTDEIAAYLCIDDCRLPVHPAPPDESEVRLVTWAKLKGRRRPVMSQICLKLDLSGRIRSRDFAAGFQHEISSPQRPMQGIPMRPTIEENTKLKECIGNMLGYQVGGSGISKVAACVFRDAGAITDQPPSPTTPNLFPVYLDVESIYGSTQTGYKFYYGDYNGQTIDKRVGGVVSGSNNYLMVWAKPNLASASWTKLYNGPVWFSGG